MVAATLHLVEEGLELPRQRRKDLLHGGAADYADEEEGGDGAWRVGFVCTRVGN